MERIQYAEEADREKFMRELFSNAGRDPDRATPDVVDEEMLIFAQASGQSRPKDERK